MPTMNLLTDKEIRATIEKKYNSVAQTHALLADTTNLIGMLGRGSGKTTEIMAPRFVRVAYNLPRATLALAGPSYAFVIDSIVPGLLTYLNKYYKRGTHFEYGKEPPRWFKRPYTEIVDWKHTISFSCGTVAKFAGVDRANTSLVGQNIAHIIIDEMLRISETNYSERLQPAKRGDRTIFGESVYFGGVTGFSSAPNFENDHDWWLAWEQNMDKELLQEIMYVAYRVSTALAKAEMWKTERQTAIEGGLLDKAQKIDANIDKAFRFAARWQPKLEEKRKGATYFMKGTSFTNLVILGLDYMREQLQGSRHNFDKFALTILNQRPKKVQNRFFSQFSNKHIFTDSYRYDNIDLYAVDGTYKRSSRDLKYCQADMPLLMGLDPGNFMSAVFAQEHSEAGTPVMRVFKNMWVITPDEHHALAEKINTFFGTHRRKVIYMYYDRAGNQRKQAFFGNAKGDTDAKILRSELQALGWTVHLMSMDQRTIYHWQHYNLNSRLMAEREKRTPRLRICQNECEELISSMNMSPLKKTDNGMIELDKSSEKRLDYPDQAWYSTQIPSALMYLVHGKYEKWIPETKNLPSDIEGL